jgi:hypothetical protein
MHRFLKCAFSFLSLALFLVACTPKGRIMDDAEDDYVGSRSAGAATYDRLIAGAVEKLLGSHNAARGGTGKLQIATLPVENASSEELGDWQEDVYEKIATSINQSERYVTINRRFVEEALRETRLRQTQLFLPKYRRAFLEALEASDNPVQLLLFPKLTTGTTRVESDSQRNYTLTLDLVDVESGKDYKVSEQVRKAYSG